MLLYECCVVPCRRFSFLFPTQKVGPTFTKAVRKKQTRFQLSTSRKEREEDDDDEEEEENL